MGVVDDEYHLVFECPAFDSVRVARPGLFSTAVNLDMRAFMGQGDRHGVFWHILNCLREVEQLEDVDRSHDVALGVVVPVDTYDSD